MHRKTALLSIHLFMLVLFACTYSTEIETLRVDLASQPTTLPSISDLRFIQLENVENALIGSITKVDYYESKYYILDARYSKALFVYDSTGNYINKTKTGRGPGEVTHPYVFNFDSESNHILLWDQGMRKMLTYNLNLDYLSDFSSEDLIIWDFEKISSNEILTYTQNAGIATQQNDSDYYYYFLRESNGTVVKQHLYCYKELRNYSLDSPIWRGEEELLFITPFNFTIYSFENNVIVPFMNIDFGNYALTAKDVKSMNFEYVDLLFKGDKLAAIDFIMNSSRYLAFSHHLDIDRHFIIYSKVKNEIYYSKHLFEEGILPKCRIHSLYKDHFIGVVEPDDYLAFMAKHDEISNPVTDPDEMDNPYLITFTLR